MADLRAVLRGDDDGGNALGLAVLVFDADLRLAVRQKIGQQLFAPHLFELSRQAVRKRDRQRHQRAGLAAGVAEHHTLIARRRLLPGAPRSTPRAMSGDWVWMLTRMRTFSASKPTTGTV